MLNVPIVAISDIPNQYPLVISLAMVLLDCAAWISDFSFAVKGLVGLVDIAKKSEVKIIKDANIMFSSFHCPTKIRFNSRDRAMVKSNIDFVYIRRFIPIIFIKNRENIQAELAV